MISKEEVIRIAKLARLDLTEKEIEKMQRDLSKILDYFDLLKKAPKPKEEKQRLGDLKCARPDEIISSYDIRDEIIASAPDKKDDYIKVKAVL